MDRGFSRGGGVPHDPNSTKAPRPLRSIPASTKVARLPRATRVVGLFRSPKDPNYSQGEGDAELAGSVPYKHALSGGTPSTGRSNVAATPEARLKELDEMTAGYSRQLDEKGIGKRAILQIRSSLGMIQRELYRTATAISHPDTPARIKALGEMEAGYTKQLGEKGLGKRVARQIRSSLGMIRRERPSLMD